ncbi:hypothetical protein BDV95DRAFT_503100 [Massariosphaeria phaeospora]|uniref:Glucose-methanol-choline oxidoreductase N-terminal domain-containing protein n=1 Tax=Massariosphaeria phaeospora TaxID=100035 RepID=A0A7C8M9A9_9PLEO|nr:hypothetical protein BDV95DRAFT_503100 [Massariosphaeria phaeospora]
MVGGGTVGCVIASRLSHAGHRVALFETGPLNYSKEVMSSSGAPLLHGTPAEYNYKTTPQAMLENREVPTYGGKVLSGSSAVNYGLWTRGHSTDYDAWAEHLGDERWSYNNLLKYFKKTENYQGLNVSSEVHGFDGPFSVIRGIKEYPLRTEILNALQQSGLEVNPDGHSGNPLGISEFTENWKNNQRQPSGLAYDLSKTDVFTDTTVARIDIDTHTKIATGVTLQDGRSVKARKEVILSCGAIRTPQVLMLSGIGPAEQLHSLGVNSIVDLPVGKNLHDHVSGSLFWKLRNPEQGLAIGSPLFNKPEYFTGTAVDWVATITIPDNLLSSAATSDGTSVDELNGPGPRAHAEILTVYAPIAGGGTDYRLPFDGTHISTPTLLLLPTSRGQITLTSTNATHDPVIDPGYLKTAVDRAVLCEGLRAAMRAMETPAGQRVVQGESPPPGFPQLTSASTDADIDARLALMGSSFYRSAGTAAMGTVVDSKCRVKGVGRLRVCDASILPMPIASHYQAAMYAVAEATAAMILEEGACE